MKYLSQTTVAEYIRRIFFYSEASIFSIKMIDSSRLCEFIASTMSSGAPKIFQTFLTFNNVLSFLGFSPFQLNVQDTKHKQIHQKSVYYTAFFVLMYSGTLLVACILGQLEPDAEESLLVRYGNYTLCLMLLSVVIFVVLFNYLKRQQIANCLLVMHHFDCMMEVGQMR